MATIQTSVGDSPLHALIPSALEHDEKEEFEHKPDIVETPEHDGVTDEDWLKEQISNTNVARDLHSEILDRIGGLVVDEYDLDKRSRSDWEDKAERAMAYVMQDAEPKQYPFPGASNVIWPLLTTAALQFGARAYPAIVRGQRVVKGVVWGSDRGTPATQDGRQGGPPKLGPDGQPVWKIAPGEKRARAERIGEHMSWQLLEQMKEWEPQLDRLLHQMPVVGGAIKKTYRDPAADRSYSVFVSLLDVVWDYNAASFETSARQTEILSSYPHEIEEFERADEMYLPQIYGEPGAGEGSPEKNQPGDSDGRHVFLEQHRRYDLDGDGYAEPWIITVHQRSAKVVRIVADFDEDGIKADDDGNIKRVEKVEQYTMIPFLPNIDGGSYPMGFGHLLKPLNEAINSTLNQMFDAGHLQNAGGGFISNQLSIKSGVVQWNVGRYSRVDTRGRDIRESIYTMQWPGASPVLFQLLGLLMTSAKELSSTQDVLTGDAGLANAPPTTLMALVEQGMRVYTAIHKRVFRALKQEFAKLYRLNRLYLKGPQGYQFGEEWRETEPEDYRLGGGVEPAGDPSMVTDMQKLSRAMVAVGVAKDDPTVNRQEVNTRLFEAAGMERIQDLFLPPDPMAAQLKQLAFQKETAEMARTRAGEQKDSAQAVFFLAQARTLVSQPQLDHIDRNIEVMRLHLEAVNAEIHAADVSSRAHNDARANEIQHAAHRARQQTESGGGAPGGAREISPGAEPGSVPGMAAPPGNAGLSSPPQGQEPELPQNGA